ncbi:Clp protease N-terminal domain-containing protein [Actinomadura sp. 9N407]|uniref:Clp protease N-terminal domain-containing protein n=1 Tax=Actinomadura sp. 9N407 TaxID=3375154 RepID=UPI00379466FE
MRPEPHPAIAGASREMVKPLVGAFKRAIRLSRPTVGTEHLLFVLLTGESAASELLAPKARVSGPLMGVIAAKDDVHWASEERAADPASAGDPAVVALLREAEWLARQSTGRRGKQHPDGGQPPPEIQHPLPTDALAAAIRQAFLHAHERGVSQANATHMLMGLIHDPGNRACEALLERRLDRDELIARLSVHPSAHQDGTPRSDGVEGLRNLGVLNQGGWKLWGGLARALTSGGFGSPIVPTVRQEARRQAVRLGHSNVTTVHLLLAMLALDDQLTTTGLRLRDGLEQNNTAAELLRAQGVTLPVAVNAAELVPAERGEPGSPVPPKLSGGAEQALTRARLNANERKDPSTGTTHLLTALLADPDDPCNALLAAVGVDTDRLRRTLGHS